VPECMVMTSAGEAGTWRCMDASAIGDGGKMSGGDGAG
jgi:hypothetical protein